MAIFEVLHRLHGASAEEVAAAVSSVLPKPVCKRTIYRDLQAMLVMGFVEIETVQNGYPKRSGNRYHLATPVTLREKIGLVEAERKMRRNPKPPM